ncbi:Amino acid transporter, transmembrane [Kalmanozyma brasiliensis GHG001]|uniref:Amino acid transporter transmembrane domain-containing protein n=1 Tax=Kalmanozyma brasiliensis (strain GHG001) TaxID=1365824 RepID=V5ESE1_KALBG|nr:Amino acid transporter, transmembrane [Kalmanozyma brasiliensis GHG001]EST04824.1 Amino acid transporter, transmembrane [Kalmanozyma brasiliensis GHG001]
MVHLTFADDGARHPPPSSHLRQHSSDQRQRRSRIVSTASIPPEGRASLISSISNLTNTIIGTGMLATPGAFKYTGLLLGAFLILFCGLSAALGLYLLTRCAARVGGRKNSFFTIASQALPAGAWYFDLAIALKCYGVSISYLIICGQLMPQVIISFFRAFHRDIHQIPTLFLDRSFWILALIILLIPLCFLRRLDSLRHTSYLSLLAVFYLVIIVLHYSFSSDARASLPPKGDVEMINVSWHTISIFPVFVFAFTCAQNMLPVYNELFHNVEGRVNTAIGSSIGTGGVVYLIVGVLGYLSFGGNVGDNIIAMYPSTSLFVCFGRVSIIILTIFSYPLQVHPCRASLDKVFSKASTRQQMLDDAAASAISTPSEVVEPYRDNEDEEEDEREPLANGHAPPEPDQEIPLAKWCLMTAGILSTTFVISLLVDDLSIILGFVGSVGSTTISFILPGVLYASLFRDEPQSRLRKAAIALAAWGCVVLVVALSANILKLIHAQVPNSLIVTKVTGRDLLW